MVVQPGQVVQPDIGSDLEFQRHIAFFHLIQKPLPFPRPEVTGIKPVTDPHPRHLLPRRQRLPHQGDAVGNIVPQGIVLARVNPDHKAFILPGDLYQFPEHRTQFQDIVDLLADDIAARHIGIPGDRPEDLQVVRQVIVRCDPVPDDRQRDPADTRQEAKQHPGLPGDCRHDLMDLPQLRGKLRPVQEHRV